MQVIFHDNSIKEAAIAIYRNIKYTSATQQKDVLFCLPNSN